MRENALRVSRVGSIAVAMDTCPYGNAAAPLQRLSLAAAAAAARQLPRVMQSPAPIAAIVAATLRRQQECEHSRIADCAQSAAAANVRLGPWSFERREPLFVAMATITFARGGGAVQGHAVGDLGSTGRPSVRSAAGDAGCPLSSRGRPEEQMTKLAWRPPTS